MPYVFNPFTGNLDVIAEPTPSTFVQGSPASTWTITHNRGDYPTVRVRDSANTRIDIFGCHYPDTNTAVLTFGAAFSGTADIG